MPYAWKPDEISTLEEAREFARKLKDAFRSDRVHADWGLAR